MDRLESIRAYLIPYKTTQVKNKIAKLKTHSEEAKLQHVHTLFQRAIEAQAQSSWEPACLCLFHLLSSIVTGSHDYQLLLANEQMYLDKQQITMGWNAEFLYKEERDALRKELQTGFVRLSDYEVSYAEHWLQYEYRKLLEVYWSEQIGKIEKFEEFIQLKKQKNFRFLYGEYMGTVKTVSLYEGEESLHGKKKHIREQCGY